MASNTVTKLTAEEYLAIDRAAEVRSEFFNGEMFAMAGGSLRHSRLQGRIYVALYTALQGSTCEPLNSDFRVRVSPEIYTYPDASVFCGTPLLADERQDTLVNPVVIFEVLSPTTEKYDRGLKFQYYRGIESLTDYILVDQNQVRIEQYTRGDANTWTLHDYQRLDEELIINSIKIRLPLARIYEGVEITESPAGAE